MGGETSQAWRAVLDDLVKRGLRKPQFLIVDGGTGLEQALATLWGDVPTQRCTVRKHRNPLAHAPQRPHLPRLRRRHGPAWRNRHRGARPYPRPVPGDPACPAEIRYGADLSVLDWAKRLVCSNAAADVSISWSLALGNLYLDAGSNRCL